MKLLFAGTPAFAAQALSALLEAGHEVALVLTQPDRPAGRGMQAKPSPVKTVALAHRLPVYQPDTLKTDAALVPLRANAADLMVVAAYGLILPQAVLDLPRLGCVNIHASLLPRWRGAAPIQRAIEAGDTETGISLMQMDAGLDTGALLSLHPLPIAPAETAGSLHDRLATLGAAAIVDLLPRLTTGAAQAVPQPESGVTYAAKITKAEARLDWAHPATELDRRIRAFNPVPGAWTESAGQILKLWRATPAVGQGAPGEILSAHGDRLRIACGGGALDIHELQLAGARRLATAAFLAGHPLAVGSRFGRDDA